MISPAGFFRPSRIGRVAPVPYAGTAALLIALIVFTPVLLATGPSSLAVQVVLEVNRPSGSSATEFEVRGIDPGVSYRWLNLTVRWGFTWSGSCPTGPLNASYLNETNETVANVQTIRYPVLVNAIAVYLSGSTRTDYAGEVAFTITGQNTSGERISYVACAATSGIPSGSWSVSLGSLDLLLQNFGSGGPS